MKRKIVVGIGEILWDMLPSGKQLGGAPANFAYFAGQLGAEAHVVSSVGDDALGKEIIQRLDKMGLGRKYLAIDSRHPTGVVNVKLDSEGKPSYEIKQNVAWDFIGFFPKLAALAKRTDAVCFGSLAQRSKVNRMVIRRFINLMPVQALKIFDINLRQNFFSREMIADLLKISNVLKINDEEIVVVSRMFALRGGEAKAVEKLMDTYRLRAVAVTKGPRGATLYSAGKAWSAKSGKIRVVDTVGAGDSFTAAFAMGMLNDLEPASIVKSAVVLAGYVCGRRGATPSLTRKLKEEVCQSF